MFKLDPSPTFWATVRLTVPGEAEPQAVELQFGHQSVDTLKAWLEDAKERDDRSTLATVVKGWRGFDAEFSADAFQKLLQNYPAAASEIFGQYIRALTESRAKN
jgi:hypothetical protein